MLGKKATRQDDERLLWMLQQRSAGRSSYDIGQDTGRPASQVRTITNRVLDADIAESGEDPETVRAAYGWDRSTGPKRRVAA